MQGAGAAFLPRSLLPRRLIHIVARHRGACRNAKFAPLAGACGGT